MFLLLKQGYLSWLVGMNVRQMKLRSPSVHLPWLKDDYADVCSVIVRYVPNVCLPNHHTINIQLENLGRVNLYSSRRCTEHLGLGRLPSYTSGGAHQALFVHRLCHPHPHCPIFQLSHRRNWRRGSGEGALSEITVKPCWYRCLVAVV